MSRIGRTPVAIPAGVSVSIDGDKKYIEIKGSKVELNYTYDKRITVTEENGNILVTRANDEPQVRALHGLTRSLIFNMVKGVTEGYAKKLEIQGVGYRAAKSGSQLVMNLGYSHQVVIDEIPGITIEVPSPTSIIIKGAVKEQVGQFAADVRSKRPPEPYKGKGIRYVGEVIILKEGKTSKK